MNLPESLTGILPAGINECLKKVGVTINEIRLRAGQGMLIKSGLKWYGVNAAGITRQEGYLIGKDAVNEIFFRACDRSVYAYANQIKNGCVTLRGGVRLGVCGTAVIENGEIVTQKDITAINIRIAREVKGCARDILCSYDGKLKSTLIIAPPYCGKTTLLRDIAASLNTYFGTCGALLIDERNEISGSFEGVSAFDLPFTDVICGCPKGIAVENIIRSMSPEVIIMDEVFERELPCLFTAANCGTRIFASIHGAGIVQAANRLGKENMTKLFERFFVLSNKERIGQIEAVYDENLSLLPNAAHA